MSSSSSPISPSTPQSGVIFLSCHGVICFPRPQAIPLQISIFRCKCHSGFLSTNIFQVIIVILCFQVTFSLLLLDTSSSSSSWPQLLRPHLLQLPQVPLCWPPSFIPMPPSTTPQVFYLAMDNKDHHFSMCFLSRPSQVLLNFLCSP